jgi:hypothetical protein
MKNNTKIARITQASEDAVKLYFAGKGWHCTKLDKPSRAALTASDWLFELEKLRFLCEVKTITSVRKGIHTESHFAAFSSQITEYFANSDLNRAPLSVQIHSQHIYQPSKEEVDQFIRWLEISLTKIKNYHFPKGWAVDALPWKEYHLQGHRI